MLQKILQLAPEEEGENSWVIVLLEGKTLEIKERKRTTREGLAG